MLLKRMTKYGSSNYIYCAEVQAVMSQFILVQQLSLCYGLV